MNTCIVWFRSDLRLVDNPALDYALRHVDRIVPVFIHAPEEAHPWAPGAASNWWLHHSLNALHEQLARRGSRLVIRRGPSLAALASLAEQCGATDVCWNRLYEPALIERDTGIKQRLAERGLICRSFNGALLFEPWSIKTQSGGPYRVFTPFWRACLQAGFDGAPLRLPTALPPVDRALGSEPIEALGLLPKIRWDDGMRATWSAGEDGAGAVLGAFIEGALADYAAGRDYPFEAHTSRLSPYLHFGEISPRQVVWAIRTHMEVERDSAQIKGGEALIRQLGWREFAHHILYHFPHTTDEPLNARFAGFPWRRHADDLLRAWQRGRTGYPLIDAGMRELWHTGSMHNRVRMIVASFLTKNCRIPWQTGARWFWDTLVDADLAANSLNWQWVAGCGADAAPYFRIFNPVRQGEKFDSAGHYVRRWVPELAPLPDRWIHAPWNIPLDIQHAAGVAIGERYPHPVIDFSESREEALVSYRDRVKAVG
jgi:deoxyribodipyrimidine photo-lyase